MAKSRKQILQELLDLEEQKVEEVEAPPSEEIISEPENTDCITRAKKARTPKQLEAFERAKAIRDANTAKRKEEAARQAEEERKLIEEKLVKKAISIKKKQIKKQAVLDELSDDDTPIEKIKEIAASVKSERGNGPFQTRPHKCSGMALGAGIAAPAPTMKFTFF